MKVRAIIKLIEADGWKFDRQRGSHMIFHHPLKNGIVVVPNHGLNIDLKKGTEIGILKMAGIK